MDNSNLYGRLFTKMQITSTTIIQLNLKGQNAMTNIWCVNDVILKS